MTVLESADNGPPLPPAGRRPIADPGLPIVPQWDGPSELEALPPNTRTVVSLQDALSVVLCLMHRQEKTEAFFSDAEIEVQRQRHAKITRVDGGVQVVVNGMGS